MEIMNAFLISYNGVSSEWKYSVVELQEEMNKLEKECIISNVKVQQFKNSILVKEFTYDYNGEEWEKR
jgi:hypothetical protein